jgi:RNA polymerase sigma factor (sigma-70 family)
MTDRLSALFCRFRDSNDLRALARLFDEVAPELASVASHMARSPDEAEDLIQATFLSAIERSANFDDRRSVVPWLLGILAMHARKQRERAGREIDAERVHQPGDADPGRDAEQSEVLFAVDSAVKQLGPNYAALVSRYLTDGATPASLAREFKLSSITARVRLHRGLKQLRKLLPIGLSVAAFGAAARRVDLAAVRANLLERAAQLTGVPVPATGFVSGALIIALLAPVALALPTWLLLRTSDPAEGAIEYVATPATTTEVGVEEAATTPDAREFAEASEAAFEATAPSTSSTVHVGHARIHGHLLRPDGTPAAGAIVKLSGMPANSEGAEQFGVPQDWSDPDPVPCSAEGEFELSFDAPPAFQFFLNAKADGCARASWRWTKLASLEVIDLGDVQLEAAGALIVRIVDEHGASLGNGWSVSAHAPAPNAVQGRDGTFVNARVDTDGSTFTLADLPARRVELSASSDTHTSIEARNVEVVAATNTQVELVYHGVDPLRRIAVLFHSRLGTNFVPAPDHIWLTRPGTVARNALAMPSLDYGFVFDDLDPGLYDLHVDDPRFEPWSEADVQPGMAVRSAVSGSSAVRVAIFEADQTPYLGRYRLSAKRVNGISFIGPPPLVSAQANPPADGLVTGLVPGDYEFELTLAGHVTEHATVAALAAQETRELALHLGWPTGIHGRVMASDGVSPMAGVDVQLTRGELADHALAVSGPSSISGSEQPAPWTRTTTDADGRFQFDDLQPGKWTVRAMWSKWLVADQTFNLPTMTPLELVQPPFGLFVGQLLLPEGVPMDDLSLWVKSMNPSAPAYFGFGMERDPSELADDGSFRIGPLPLGEIDVGLMLFMGSLDADSGRAGTGPNLGRFTIEAGTPIPHQVDARSNLPCRIHGRVVIDGVGASEGWVGAYTVSGQHKQGSGRGISIDGNYWLGSLAPNQPLDLKYVSPTGWAWAPPNALQVESAGNLELMISIATAERELQIVDAATNLPRANQRIAWRTGPDFAATHDDEAALAKSSATSDAQGKLKVRLPLGQVRFVALPSGACTTPAVDWTADSAPIVLRFQ